MVLKNNVVCYIMFLVSIFEGKYFIERYKINLK